MGQRVLLLGRGQPFEDGYEAQSDMGRGSPCRCAIRQPEAEIRRQGIPVVLGEFSAMRRKNLAGDALALHLKSRNDYHTRVVKAAVANGVLPFYWDVGVTDGIFDRKTNLVRDRQTLDAVMAGLPAK